MSGPATKREREDDGGDGSDVVVPQRLTRSSRERAAEISHLDLLSLIAGLAAKAGYVREMGSLAATCTALWTTVPSDLSEEDEARVRSDSLLWQELVKVRACRCRLLL